MSLRLRRFVIGRQSACCCPLAAVQERKPAYDGWSLLAALPVPNSETGVAELDGKIYVIGGYPCGSQNRCRQCKFTIRKPTNGRSSRRCRVPLNHVMAAAANGKVYVIGGQTTETSEPEKAGFVNTVYEYDPATGNRGPLDAPMPTRRGGGVAAVVDGKIYVAGGRPPGGADFAVYDPKADQLDGVAEFADAAKSSRRGRSSTARFMFSAGGSRAALEASNRRGGSLRSQNQSVVEATEPMLRPRGGVNGIFANGCFHLFGGEGNPNILTVSIRS